MACREGILSQLSEFAQLVKKANEEKEARLAEQKEESIKKANTTLADLFGAVAEGKKKTEAARKEAAPILSEFEEALKDPTSIRKKKEERTKKIVQAIESLENKIDEIAAAPVEEVKPDPQEKNLVRLFERLQKDFQTLKNTVSADKTAMQNYVTQAIANSSGGGSVRILDNDDVEFTKISEVTQNCIMIFDATKKKFVIKDLMTFIQNIQSGVEMQYNKIIDVQGQFTYIGEAAPGTSTESPLWRIKRIEDLGGGDINILWANGTADFTQTWSLHLTYSYS